MSWLPFCSKLKSLTTSAFENIKKYFWIDRSVKLKTKVRMNAETTILKIKLIRGGNCFIRKRLWRRPCHGDGIVFLSGFSRFWFSEHFPTHVRNSLFYPDLITLKFVFFIRFGFEVEFSVRWVKMDKKTNFYVIKSG